MKNSIDNLIEKYDCWDKYEWFSTCAIFDRTTEQFFYRTISFWIFLKFQRRTSYKLDERIICKAVIVALFDPLYTTNHLVRIWNACLSTSDIDNEQQWCEKVIRSIDKKKEKDEADIFHERMLYMLEEKYEYWITSLFCYWI